MSLSDSDDDIEPGSSADSLLRRMGRRAPTATPSSRAQQDVTAMDPTSLEAQLSGAGVTSPFNIWPLEDSLRQQASCAVGRRHHEIEACERALDGALAELHRVRAAEESRLAARVAEAARRFQQQMEALQQQYLLEVEKLKRQTMADLNKQRAISETAIAARSRALQAELRYDRPAGLSSSVAAPAPSAPPPLLQPPLLRARDRSSGPGPARFVTGAVAAGGSSAAAWKPSAVVTRRRSARPGGAAGAVGTVASSHAAAATPFAAGAGLNLSKLETGEGLW